MNMDENEPAPHLPTNLALEDKWILSRFAATSKEVTENLEKFELGLAVQKLYDFIWDVFCDWYIELAKIRLQQGGEGKETAKAVLVFVMSNTLKLLHPFMPFITEEIWQTLPHEGESIMISKWPEYDESLDFAAEELEMERIMEAVRAVRNRRAEMNVPPSRKAKLFIETVYIKTFESAGAFMQKLAWASEVEVGNNFNIENAVSIITEDAKIFIPMGDLVDFEAERARLNKELAATEKNLEGIQSKLANEGFVSKAPIAVVEAQRETGEKLKDKITMLQESLSKF
jgi:valyl-tRNA synthetase